MARSPTAEAQKENPDSVAAEIGVEGIEALPKRVERYGKSKKKRSRRSGVYARAAGAASERRIPEGDGLRGLPSVPALLHRGQGEAARGSVLQGASALPPVRDSSRRQGSRGLPERWEAIRLQRPTLRPFLVTLTVKDGPDLAERFAHLHKAQRELWKRKHRIYESSLDGVDGAVWSYEIKRGQGSGLWHPHLHMIALAEVEPDAEMLSASGTKSPGIRSSLTCGPSAR